MLRLKIANIFKRSGHSFCATRGICLVDNGMATPLVTLFFTFVSTAFSSCSLSVAQGRDQHEFALIAINLYCRGGNITAKADGRTCMARVCDKVLFLAIARIAFWTCKDFEPCCPHRRSLLTSTSSPVEKSRLQLNCAGPAAHRPYPNQTAGPRSFSRASEAESEAIFAGVPEIDSPVPLQCSLLIKTRLALSRPLCAKVKAGTGRGLG